jgi:hypothetical protein
VGRFAKVQTKCKGSAMANASTSLTAPIAMIVAIVLAAKPATRTALANHSAATPCNRKPKKHYQCKNSQKQLEKISILRRVFKIKSVKSIF